MHAANLFVISVEYIRPRPWEMPKKYYRTETLILGCWFLSHHKPFVMIMCYKTFVCILKESALCSIIMYLLSTCLNLITVPTINESWDVIRQPNFPQNFPCSHECGFSIKIIRQARLLTSPEMCLIPETIVQFPFTRHRGRSTKFTNKSAGCIAYHTVCHKTMKVTAENFQNVKYLCLK